MKVEGRIEMNMMVAILYAPEGQKPLSIARVSDRALLATVAEKAICEAEAAASDLMADDPILGALQFEEANKLRRVLRLLMPNEISAPTAAVM